MHDYTLHDAFGAGSSAAPTTGGPPMRAGVPIVTLVFVIAAQLTSFTADEHVLADRALGRSQHTPTSGAPQDRFVWLTQRDEKLLQGQLDDLAARGYRIVFVSNLFDY